MGRGKAAASLAILDVLKEVLSEHHPMTVRQAYYQLVSRQVIENTRASYQKVSGLLVDARKDGSVPWAWIEDRLRRPRTVSMWDDPADFAETACAAYRRDVWATQREYFETWLEKDALSGIFEDVLRPYGVTLNVGRGYDGWDSIRNAAARFTDRGGTMVLYFGDFDPSGEDMARSLRERLAWFGMEPEIVKVALTAEDIDRYHLPPDPAKRTEAKKRQATSTGGADPQLEQNSAQAAKGKTRDELAEREGIRAALAGGAA